MKILTIILLTAWFSSAHAQPISSDALKDIRFEQKTGTKISLDLPFKDEQGRTVRLGDFFGKKPVILVLGYSRCPMLCSFVLNGLVQSLQDIQWDSGKKFQVVDVSIDPMETPEIAAASKERYVKRYGRPDAANGWHFLTGDDAQIHTLANEVGFLYAYDPEIKQYAHPSGLVILTPEGKISQYLSGVVYSAPQLKTALQTASVDRVGPPLEQFFLLCFHYSPITGKYGSIVMLGVRITGTITLFFLGWIIFKETKRNLAAVRRPKS